MKKIYASKLFKASTRKAKIQAAMENFVNTELITQLEEYLDDEYKPLNDIVEDTSDNVDTPEINDIPDDSQGDTSQDISNHPMSHTPHKQGVKLSEQHGDDLDTEGNDAFDETQVDLESAASDIPDSDSTTNASTTIDKNKKVVAETIISTPLVETQISLSGLAGEIKGTLNARNNTVGVNRVSVKNNELWIYYNDDINLNNIMSQVIELLNAINYYYLDFNRLARSENAMVFTINGNDTNNIGRSEPNG